MEVNRARPIRFIAAMLMIGYGGLVTLRLLAHEALWMGILVLATGAALLAFELRARPEKDEKEPRATNVSRGHRVAVAVIGLLAAGGILAYNALAGSSLSLPEMAILGYGVLLLIAAPRLHTRIGRTDVGTLVAWSFPLLAAPLALYSIDALFDAQLGRGQSPLDSFIVHWLVAPMAFFLDALGFDAVANGQTVGLGTATGYLFLNVGVVCAGIEPGVLFLGVFGLYAWQEQMPWRRLAVLLALGLLGVYVGNLIRLVLLAIVGVHWGGSALQTAHAHAGWMIFVGWMVLYWWLVLRRFHKPTAAGPNSA